MSAPSRELAEGAPLPSATRRNLIWWSFQQVLQNAFGLWLRYRARGLEHVPREGPALLLSNHQSYLDPLLIGLPLQRPVSYLARHNLFDVPFVGWLLRRTYVMPIRRDAAGSASLREIVRRLDHGFLVGVFPEGTRTRNGSLGELKPGFLAIIRRSSVPVIPVGISGANVAMPRGAAIIRPTRVSVVYGQPLLPAEFEGRSREEILTLIRERISHCVESADRHRRGHDVTHAREDDAPPSHETPTVTR